MSVNKLNIGVIGSGLMGKGLVQLLISSDHIDKVYWKSGHSPSLAAPLNQIEAVLKRLVSKNKITEEQFLCCLNKIILCQGYAELSNCQIIHEAVSEDLVVKSDIFLNLDAVLPADAIIATNTSSLSITELAFLTKRPENIIGMHFFNPAPIMKLVEVIPSLATSDSTKEFVLEYAKNIGKTAVEVEDAPGFIVNRLLMPMINEAICILAEHVATKESIDSAMRCGANHPIGPLALADMIGNDVVLSIMEVLYKETGDQKYRPHPFLKKMVRAGKLGKKTSSGFYEY